MALTLENVFSAGALGPRRGPVRLGVVAKVWGVCVAVVFVGGQLCFHSLSLSLLGLLASDSLPRVCECEYMCVHVDECLCMCLCVLFVCVCACVQWHIGAAAPLWRP